MLHSSLLTQLDEVARRGSIRAAAAVLNVSASSINRRLIQLESELGAPLFDRHAAGMHITTAGEVVIAHIRQTLRDKERMTHRLREMIGVDGPLLRISAMHGLTAGVIPKFLRSFRAQNPNIAVTVRSQPEDQVEHDLATGGCDIGLGYSWPNGTGITASRVFPTRLGVVVGQSHPLARKKSVRLAEVAQWPIALPDESVAINLLVTEAFTKLELPLSPIILSNSIELLKSIARTGEALTFLSRIDVEEELNGDQISYVPIHTDDISSHELRLGRRKDSTVNSAVAIAEECIREVIARIETPIVG